MKLSEIVYNIRAEWIKSLKVGTLLESIGHTAYGRASGDIIRLDGAEYATMFYTIVKPNNQAMNKVKDRQYFSSSTSSYNRFKLAE